MSNGSFPARAWPSATRRGAADLTPASSSETRAGKKLSVGQTGKIAYGAKHGESSIPIPLFYGAIHNGSSVPLSLYGAKLVECARQPQAGRVAAAHRKA